jgi:hypothetical protein
MKDFLKFSEEAGCAIHLLECLSVLVVINIFLILGMFNDPIYQQILSILVAGFAVFMTVCFLTFFKIILQPTSNHMGWTRQVGIFYAIIRLCGSHIHLHKFINNSKVVMVLISPFILFGCAGGPPNSFTANQIEQLRMGPFPLIIQVSELSEVEKKYLPIEIPEDDVSTLAEKVNESLRQTSIPECSTIFVQKQNLQEPNWTERFRLYISIMKKSGRERVVVRTEKIDTMTKTYYEERPFYDIQATYSLVDSSAPKDFQTVFKFSVYNNRNDNYLKLSYFIKDLTNLLAQKLEPFRQKPTLAMDNGISKKNASLIRAAENGNLGVVQTALTEGADINATKKVNTAAGSVTPLFLASTNGHMEIVRLLLDKGADVNIKAADGTTALFRASSNGHTEIVRLLLDKGADVNIKAADGTTALKAAKSKGQSDISRMLERSGTKE